MKTQRRSLVVVGTAFHAPTPERLEVLDRVAVSVDPGGVIEGIHPADSEQASAAVAGADTVVHLPEGTRLLPGLIDLHVHAPQWPQLGTGLDLPLQRWLMERTFRLEARYADERFAAAVWAALVPALLAHGTTTAVYFSSIHVPATRLLAEQCLASGQRAFVGRVAQDHPSLTPDWYRDTDPLASVEATRRSIEEIRALAGPAGLVRPAITPRFVPACSDELLRGLGLLAEDTGVLVQTHCSESDWEHDHVVERFGRTDTQVLDGFGLLRRSTVLAHCTHVGDDDLRAIAAARAGIAHCPISNAYFAGAVLPVRAALGAGALVGLGSDIAGGDQPGILANCRMAVTASRMLEGGVDARVPAGRRGVDGARIDHVVALHLATACAADVLGLPAGRFAPGLVFDAIAVDTAGLGAGHAPFADDADEPTRCERIVRLAGPQDITHVWVSGRLVAGSGSEPRR